MTRGRLARTGVGAGIVIAMLAPPAFGQACDKIGVAPIEVCKVVGVRCSPPTGGVCVTVVTGLRDSDCICAVQPPGGFHVDLAAVGPLPNADGVAFIDIVGGVQLAAIGLEGLVPLAPYRARNHPTGNCFDGQGVPIGLDFQANPTGDAGIIGEIQNPRAISIQDQAGVPVLCGTLQPIATTPSAFGSVKILYR